MNSKNNNNMNTTESNKLIAKFMGVKYKSDSDYIKDIEEMRGNGIFYDQGCFMESELKYNSSWDWLMPVVEKIEQIENRLNGNSFQVVICEEEIDIIEKNSNYWKQIINVPCNGDSKLTNTYKAVVEFIKINNEII